MPLHASCSVCNASLNVPDACAGQTIKCPRCAAQLVVPNLLEEVTVEEEEVLPARRRRPEADAAGIVALVLACMALLVSVSGLFTCGIGFFLAVPLALGGLIAGCLGRSGLAIAGIVLSIVALVPPGLAVLGFAAFARVR